VFLVGFLPRFLDESESVPPETGNFDFVDTRAKELSKAKEYRLLIGLTFLSFNLVGRSAIGRTMLTRCAGGHFSGRRLQVSRFLYFGISRRSTEYGKVHNLSSSRSSHNDLSQRAIEMARV
jgi:hypothetical protein